MRPLMHLGLVLAVAGFVASGQDTTRLQQQVDNLRFRLDYETSRFEQRIEMLERQVRQMEGRQQPAVGGSPSSPTLALPPAAPLEEITTRRVTVTDEEGRVRGVLAVSSLYGPMLGLLNERGDVVTLLSAPADGPRLEIFDDLTAPRVRLGLADSDAALHILDGNGEVAARLPVRR